jgi:Glycosyl hydrolase family 10
MGAIHFRVARPDLLPAESELSSVDFLMYDGRILPAQIFLKGNQMTCVREIAESGQLRLPWMHMDRKPGVVHSTSLREQATAYDLELELARGQLSRLRNQYSIWTFAGLQTSPELETLLSDAHHSFRSAALCSDSPETAAAAAILSIDCAAKATELLCRHYTEQRLSFRRNRSPHLPVSLGCRLDAMPRQPEKFCELFNAVHVDTSWNRLEPRDGEYDFDDVTEIVDWALRQRLSVLGGPLLDLSTDRFPAWLNAWSGDLTNLQSFAADYVETVIRAFLGKIRHWEVVAGGNCGGAAQLTEEQRMNLLARVVEAASHVDEHIQISLRVTQPWGEYLSQTSNRLPPVQFIDTLRRCGVRFAEINLEIGHLIDAQGRLIRRDDLSLSQLLDQWSLLQVPLNVILKGPSPAHEDDLHARWLRDSIMMTLAKERVVGVYYDPCTTQEVNARTVSVCDDNGELLPAAVALHGLRTEYWEG